MATRTWDGGGADALASTVNNWSDNTAPVSGDIVIFDATSSNACTWDLGATVDLASINTTGYGGVITASSILKVSGNITFANSTFAHGNQEVQMDATLTLNAGTAGNGFYDLTVTTTVPTITLSNDITVNHTLKLVNSLTTSIWAGNKTINCKGDVDTSAGSAIGGGANITINGSGDQNITGNASNISIPGILTVASTGGTVYFKTALNPYTDIVYTSGTVDFSTYTCATKYMAGSVQGVTLNTGSSMVFYSFQITGIVSPTYTLSGDLYVSNTLDLGGSIATNTFNGSKIYASGNVTRSADARTNGTTVLEFTGNGNQQWDQAGGNTYEMQPDIIVNKSGGTLTISGTVRVDGNFTYTAGTGSAAGSTVDFYEAHNLNGGTLPFNNVAIKSNTRTLTGNLDVNGNLNIDSGTTLSAGANQINIAGNFTNLGTFTRATSTVVFDG